MAIERMKIACIIGKRTDLDKVSRLVVINGRTHILNALSELNSNNLNLSASQEHMQTLQELSHVRAYVDRKDLSGDERIIRFFQELFNLKSEISEDYLSVGDDYENTMVELRKVYDNVKHISEGMSKSASNLEKLQNYLNNTKYIRNMDLRLEEIKNMSFMKFRLLMLSNENFIKLKLNFENLPSIVFPVAALDGNKVIVAFTPENLREEAERIFISLNYKELELPREFDGTPEDVIKRLNEGIRNDKRQIEEYKESVIELNERYRDIVSRAYTLLELEKKAEKVKQETALGHSMFFMFGFIPNSEIEGFRTELQQYFEDSIIFVVNDVEYRRSGNVPPTKMKNNFLFKPFESLISMYGIPSYGEKDPTPFFALSYLLMFGAMFGDLGQG
ncbi:MAG: V-type ATPase 116kDa subunit family protein, partial [Clostridiaceae bacterium]|nr:V-type ATPase 116kDa subunit family protein [Clostridiaceae bacterium]